jgi:hypothetical protein
MMKTRTSLTLLFGLISILTIACSQTAGIVEQTIPVVEELVSDIADSADSEEGNSSQETEDTSSIPVDESATDPVTSLISYPIVDTGQGVCYDDFNEVACPQLDAAFFGQDAQYSSGTPDYTDNGDGTVSDTVSGLIWQQSPDMNGDGSINAADKMTYDEALAGADSFSLAGYDDWRLPSIKELYSLILFDGTDPSGLSDSGETTIIPFIDTRYFDFNFGDSDAGERIIDAQYASSTKYVSTTMNGAETMFGVNLADGRIKGYGLSLRGSEKSFYVLYVRGNTNYGMNDFSDNADGTITDIATGLMWQQDDSGEGLDWEESLGYCEVLDTAGYDDWRLPNVKELQSIVDYSLSPDTSGSAAIDPLFDGSSITNEAGQSDYPAYWSSTTHANLRNGGYADYVSFGRSMGYMQDTWMDVHGAGAQRSDPKSGDPDDYPTGHGPQGDAIRIDNYVRCVRGGDVSLTPEGDSSDERPGITIQSDSSQSPEQAGEPGQQGQQPIGGNGPPQEAINACTGLAEGDTCSVNTPNGTLQGTCSMVQDTFACKPEGGPPAQNTP